MINLTGPGEKNEEIQEIARGSEWLTERVQHVFPDDEIERNRTDDFEDVGWVAIG